MFELFKQDACRWIVPGEIRPESELTPRALLRMLYYHAGLRAMAWFRFGSWCKQRRIPMLTGLIQYLIYRAYGLEILIGAEIGGGLYIPHTVGTTISPKRMGRNCSVIALVTIGMRNEHAFPNIGDNVFIGAGARILGGITIGDGAVIGANAVVIKDIPAGATAVGIPARLVGIERMLAI